MFNKYSESGFSVIPVYKNAKNPSISKWQQYCTTHPAQDLINAWDRQFSAGQINIGLACGKASNIIALDIDSDDQCCWAKADGLDRLYRRLKVKTLP